MTNTPSPASQTIQHFSHSHPLVLTAFQSQPGQLAATCSCCKSEVQSPAIAYYCSSCEYFLHFSCSQLPTKVIHQFHKEHVLSLLSSPVYPGGEFRCDACGKCDKGFNFHCESCNVDLHPACAALPTVLRRECHEHQLDLTSKTPYDTKSFKCDSCRTLGSEQWLYRCNVCEFSFHLECAKSGIIPMATNPYNTTRSIPHMQSSQESPMNISNHFAGRPTGTINSMHNLPGTNSIPYGLPIHAPEAPAVYSPMPFNMPTNDALTNQYIRLIIQASQRQQQNAMQQIYNSIGGARNGGLFGGLNQGGGNLDMGSLLGGGNLDIGSLIGGGNLDIGSLLGGGNLDVGSLLGGGNIDFGSLLGGGLNLGGLLGGFGF